MAGWERKYSVDQKRAIVHARLERGLSGKVVELLAGRGELTTLDGTALEPFHVPAASVYSFARDEESRRRAAATSMLATQPAGDAIEEIRRRLVAALDHETMRLDTARKRKPREPADAEQLRRCARALRELAAMPAPGERGRQPGRQAGGERLEGEAPAKPDSMAGKIAASLSPRGFADAAQDDVTPLSDGGDATADSDSAQDSASAGAQDASERINGGLEGDAGTYARAQTAGLRALAVEQQ